MNITLKDHGMAAHAAVLMQRIEERISVSLVDGGYEIELLTDSSIGRSESYRIERTLCGVRVIGSDEAGLWFGIGKLLHSAAWQEDGFVPIPTHGTVTPDCSLRAMYFSVHYYNWYHMTSTEELERYIEDMLLWGYNAIFGVLPVVNIVEWGDSLHLESRERLRLIYRAAKRYGMKVGTLLPVNQAIQSAPHELDNDSSFNLLMRGNFGRNLCMSKPESVKYMRGVWQKVFEVFEGIGLDYIVTWPYDEGGCGCPNCRPWGANKYLDTIKWLREETQKYFSETKFIVSTWAFDDPVDEGEYEGLYRRLNGDMSWVDVLMIDSHGVFPQYALEHTTQKPIVNFPEISMWGLIPWGGFGANPLPRRFQAIWDSSKHLLDGGIPYSEGIYEDISKIQCVGYYWNRDASWQEILGEYIRFEYQSDAVGDVLDMMDCIEHNHALVGDGKEPEVSYAIRAAELARRVDARLSEKAKQAWRWRILYIRAILDEKRYVALQTAYPNDPKRIKRFSLFSGDLLLEDREAQGMFAELQALYHCVPANGQNHFTLPPLGGTAHKEDI